MKTCLHLALASTLLFAAVGCGNNKKSKKAIGNKTTQPVVESTIDWRITLNTGTFPARSRVEVNGSDVTDECLEKSPKLIDRSAMPEVLTIPAYFMPKAGALSINVYNCVDNSLFLTDANVDFTVSKVGTANVLEIKL
ncbi:MAG TPA: hypothetical protein VNJ01_01075 [Bacteriovoracaceae bacterium]|nr:hypothetical protein [Bacteriovoracaceae bacterium]